MRKVKDIENPTAYERVLRDEAVYDFAIRCGDFRHAEDTLKDGAADSHYQCLFDRMVDGLILAYDSGGIETTIDGLREGMHKRRSRKF